MKRYIDHRKISVITITYNRNQHLNNLIKGLQSGQQLPDELVIVNMGGRIRLDEDITIPVRIFDLTCHNHKDIPLAQARNIGAKHAYFENLVFLDVDCIPSYSFIRQMREYIQLYPGIIMGTPHYLHNAVGDTFTEEQLLKDSEPHPDRPEVIGLRQENTYELFWSLCFATTKTQYNILEGFDEQYKGYGGEDTDFSFKARAQNCPFYICDAIVYHQPHSVHKPPLHQFEPIVNNCNYFYSKWGLWPMDRYLKQFTESKLIDWNPGQHTPITIRQKPSHMAVERSFVANAPYA